MISDYLLSQRRKKADAGKKGFCKKKADEEKAADKKEK